jgi:transcriptional regulator with XRE-family HTH domain
MKDINDMTFGEFLKAKRREKRITLRRFCELAGADPGNVSKIENSIIPPPQKESVLRSFAEVLGIEANSDDWTVFSDMAAAQAGKIPNDLLKSKETTLVFPMLFRTLRNERPSRKDLERVLDFLNGDKED